MVSPFFLTQKKKHNQVPEKEDFWGFQGWRVDEEIRVIPSATNINQIYLSSELGGDEFGWTITEQRERAFCKGWMDRKKFSNVPLSSVCFLSLSLSRFDWLMEFVSCHILFEIFSEFSSIMCLFLSLSEIVCCEGFYGFEKYWIWKLFAERGAFSSNENRWWHSNGMENPPRRNQKLTIVKNAAREYQSLRKVLAKWSATRIFSISELPTFFLPKDGAQKSK